MLAHTVNTIRPFVKRVPKTVWILTALATLGAGTATSLSLAGTVKADAKSPVQTGGVEINKPEMSTKTAAASVDSMTCWQHGTKVFDHQGSGKLLFGRDIGTQQLTILGEDGGRTIIVQLGETICAVSGE